MSPLLINIVVKVLFTAIREEEKKGGEMDVEVRKYEIKHDLQKT